MGLPSASEARPVTVPMLAADLRVGDQIGPEDVSLPATHTIVGVPERTESQRIALARGAGVELPVTTRATDSTVTVARRRVTDTLHVRRYESLATVTRADGHVERPIRVLLRPAGDMVTFDSTPLMLRYGDSVTLSAPPTR